MAGFSYLSLSLSFNLSLSFRVWFPPLSTALTMQMCRRQSVKNLGAGINISRRQRIWWVSRTAWGGFLPKNVTHTLLSFTRTNPICCLTKCVFVSLLSHEAADAFLSCYLIIWDYATLFSSWADFAFIWSNHTTHKLRLGAFFLFIFFYSRGPLAYIWSL